MTLPVAVVGSGYSASLTLNTTGVVETIQTNLTNTASSSVVYVLAALAGIALATSNVPANTAVHSFFVIILFFVFIFTITFHMCSQSSTLFQISKSGASVMFGQD